MTALEREIEAVATYAAGLTVAEEPEGGWKDAAEEGAAALDAWRDMSMAERRRWTEAVKAVLGMVHDADALDEVTKGMNQPEADFFREQVVKTRVMTPVLTDWLRLNEVKRQLLNSINTIDGMQRDLELKR